ncbi:MAG: UDP-N-acetylenolpyruvoylglucosamine reductase [Proteobacteria bacterium]|nr:MAG: UDP-N-acetylenolpyruvoylglucosamine reductase [Pseudomonadota bacterium]
MLSSESSAEFAKLTGLKPRCGVLGSSLTTLCVGGTIAKFLELQSPAELCSAVTALRQLGESWRIIGAGSNLLIPSAGLEGWLMRLGRGFRYARPQGAGRFLAGGATSLMALSRELSMNGFSGLEFAGGIPASIGGALRMNAGAHGSEMASVLQRIWFVDCEGKQHSISANELSFGYRSCSLPHTTIVTQIEIELAQGHPREIGSRRATFLAERKSRQPLSLPSAGSVFRNPSASESAGSLIEKVGLKGFQIGGAQISELHANWIVNLGRLASDGDIRSLIELCRSKVAREFKFELEPEIVIW